MASLTQSPRPIAHWLEHPTGTWKVMGSTPVGRTQSFFLSIRLESVISFFPKVIPVQPIQTNNLQKLPLLFYFHSIITTLYCFICPYLLVDNLRSPYPFARD